MENKFYSRDVISIDDFSREDIDLLMEASMNMKSNLKKYSEIMNGRIMAPLFFEDSTRTFTSFQSAMIKLGGRVIDFDKERSSLKKGESLADTIRMFDGYSPDLIVIRHPRDGSAQLAADYSKSPVINAGDGANQHPTQTFLDLFTIKEILGSIDSARIALVGDLKYGRTVHSLSNALTQYSGVEVCLVSPESLRMPQKFLKNLEKAGIKFNEFNLDFLKNAVHENPIIYMTRVQRERFPEGPEGDEEYKRISRVYRLTREMVERNPFVKIMHPLPKVGEVDPYLDKSDSAYYYHQAANGLPVRQALISLVTGDYYV